MSQSESPDQVADRARSDPASSIAPLGTVDVGSNSGTLTVTLPAGTARELDIEQGDEIHVGYDPDRERFVYEPAGSFDGW